MIQLSLVWYIYKDNEIKILKKYLHFHYIPSLFTVNIWTQTKCSPMDEWINRLWYIYIYTVEYYSALKMKEILSIVSTCTIMKNIVCVSHSVTYNSLRPHGLQPMAPVSMEFSRQEYQSGLPFPSPGDLPDLGIEPCVSCIGRQILYHLSHQRSNKLSTSIFKHNAIAQLINYNIV